jgi:hypothetical protein
MAAQISRPNISIGQLALGNIAHYDLTVIVQKMKQEIDKADAPEETKEEARGRLRKLTDTASAIGAGAAGVLLAAALRGATGLP